MPAKGDYVYIYGIIEGRQAAKFEFSGLEGAVVYVINFRDLGAAVSHTGSGDIEPTRKNVLAHTLVQDELLRKYTILPMGFGTVTASGDDVLKMLQRNYVALMAELGRLAGKIEAELKVFWNEKALAGENAELLSRLKTNIKSASNAVEAQRLAIEAGVAVERIVREWRSTYANQVYSTLREIAADARLNAPAGVKNLLNASFLIERIKESEFVERVRRMDAEYEGKINFKYIGPLSPYSFVDIRLEPVN